MTLTAWRLVDGLAHVLYVPLCLGRRHGRVGWRTRVHLIPEALLTTVCDAYDRWLECGDHHGPRPEEAA